MTRGRKPLTDKQKEARGRKPGHDSAGRKIDKSPEAKGLPRKPSNVSEEEDPLASYFWDMLVPQLEAMQILGEIDEHELAMLCQMWSRYQASLQLSLGDPTDKDIRGAVSTYFDKFHKLAASFGLNPADRARLSIAPKEQESKSPYSLVG